eukprot:m51a1_g6569 hypothetical protein (305) ;mRNA; r:179135-180359
MSAKQATLLRFWDPSDPRAAAAVPDVEDAEAPGYATANCVTGCEHNCRYCYARHFAVTRFSQLTADRWPHPKVRWAEVRKKRGRVGRTVFFPSSHDITPSVLGPCRELLLNVLRGGNRVLVVSKPHLACVRDLCAALAPYRPRVAFLFTITALDDALLAYWEPGAPGLAERLACLRLACERGYATSVNVEPMLQPRRARELYEAVDRWVTGHVRFGMMNMASERVAGAAGPGGEDEEERARLGEVLAGQTPEALARVRDQLSGLPKVRWTESTARELARYDRRMRSTHSAGSGQSAAQGPVAHC